MLDSRTASLSLAATSGIMYSVCALFVYLFPQGTLAFFDAWFHGIELKNIASTEPVGMGEFVMGLITVVAVSYASAMLFAFFYNRLSNR